MSDDYDRMSNTSSTSAKGDEAFAKRKAGMHKNELNEQLKEYINSWRDERSKEEEEPPRSSGLSGLSRCGRTRTESGPRGPRSGCPSGSGSGRERRLVIPTPPRVGRRPLRRSKIWIKIWIMYIKIAIDGQYWCFIVRWLAFLLKQQTGVIKCFHDDNSLSCYHDNDRADMFK